MHRDHNIFVRAIRDRKKVKLTFPSKEQGSSAERLFGPVFYSSSTAGDVPDCYYVWDFDCSTDNHFLGLVSSQIVSIEATEEPFDLVEFFTSEGQSSKS